MEEGRPELKTTGVSSRHLEELKMLAEKFEQEPAAAADDWYNAGYRDLAEVIKHVSAQPGQDLQRLYRQMVFNVMIGNTDDHLKNFDLLVVVKRKSRQAGSKRSGLVRLWRVAEIPIYRKPLQGKRCGLSAGRDGRTFITDSLRM